MHDVSNVLGSLYSKGPSVQFAKRNRGVSLGAVKRIHLLERGRIVLRGPIRSVGNDLLYLGV